MRLVDAEGHTVATINTNNSLTLDEAINLVGEIITGASDPRYDDEDGNVIIDDNRYQYDELDLWPDVDIEAARRLGRECAESIDVADIGDDWEADAAGFVNAWGFCDDTDPKPRFMMDDADHVNRDAADAWNEGFQEGWTARKAECDKGETMMTYVIEARRTNDPSQADGYSTWEYAGEWDAEDADDALDQWLDEQVYETDGFERTGKCSYRINDAEYDARVAKEA